MKTIEKITTTKLEAYSKMACSNGSMFTVKFIKKDGTIRVMNCRTGVKKYLKGGELKYTPIEKLLFSVFDMQKKEYRMINLKTLFELKINKVIYEVI